VRGGFGTKDPDNANTIQEMACAMVEPYDAFEDNPWPVDSTPVIRAKRILWDFLAFEATEILI
jgi:hypothetical protein